MRYPQPVWTLLPLRFSKTWSLNDGNEDGSDWRFRWRIQPVDATH